MSDAADEKVADLAGFATKTGEERALLEENWLVIREIRDLLACLPPKAIPVALRLSGLQVLDVTPPTETE